MKDILEVDKNFVVKSEINKPDVLLRSALEPPFSLHGVFYEDGKFRRLPESAAQSVSEKVAFLHSNTAGGRIRFCTDSSYVAVAVQYGKISRMSHFALTGSAGLDLYADDVYAGTFKPLNKIIDSFQGVVDLGQRTMREITIHLPLYSEVTDLQIGLQESASLEAPTPYTHQKPMVFYGSSITQGGCASRPGNGYTNILSRRLSADHINLGFSGSALAEDAIAQYISGLDMSVFIYDYDHNAPNAEHLQNTHERMYRIIRKAHPQLPILMLSRPRARLNAVDQQRLEIIRATYEKARAAGDTHVYFIPGPELMVATGNDGTVDGTHPNDLGFHSMANALTPVLRQILK